MEEYVKRMGNNEFLRHARQNIAICEIAQFVNDDNTLTEEEHIPKLFVNGADPSVESALYFALYYSGWDRSMAPKSLPKMDALNDVI